MIEFTIPIEPVTKKNSNEIHVNNVTGKRFVAPSEKFIKYQRAVEPYIWGIKSVDEYPVNIECHFYMSTRRRVDLTNLLGAIDDVLVHYGIIEDDDYKHLARHDGSRVCYDKENPRTVIKISRMIGEESFVIVSNRFDGFVEGFGCGSTPSTPGKWITRKNNRYFGGGYYQCSKCLTPFAWGSYHELDDCKFCPECGGRLYKQGGNK